MEAGKVLELLRPLVLVVDARGIVRGVHGGSGGFLGHDLPGLVGSNVLGIVAPEDRTEVASYFVHDSNERLRTTLLPLPYRVRALDSHGETHLVDVIPTGLPDDPETPGWVVVLTPLALQTGPSRPLDAQLAGAPRDTVKQLLAEELRIDHAEWVTRLFLVDLPSGEVTSDRDDEFGLRTTIQEAVRQGWEPWHQIGDGTGAYDVALEDAPSVILTGPVGHGWSCIEAAPVDIGGELVAAFVLMTRAVGSRSPFECVRTNVESRMRGLVDVTRMLYGRWRDKDALLVAATTDSLTGLANRETLALALAQREPATAVLYVDIDHFKCINDQYGHTVGDLVLVEVARRISSACRRDDVVARIGGDEFVVLLRKVDEVIAGRICRRILDEVRVPFTLVDGPRDVSVSIGLAMWNHGGDLLELADQAMLQAKRQGRARLVLA